jgi:nascent polypeptide-associated complex subunit alpha
MDPRQMSAMMKKLGIDVRDIEGVQEVLVRTASKDYVFDKASVSVMKAQGVETWQVSGKPRTVERTGGATPAVPAKSTSGAIPAPMPPAPEALPVISDDDVALVMGETGRSRAEARAALEATKGDLAEAILKLSQG